MLFHDQPAVAEFAALAQRKLTGVTESAGLDLVERQWLHLTTLIVGFADEVPEASLDAMVAMARDQLASVPPIKVTLGRVYYHPEAVVLVVEPLDALVPVLDAVRSAAAAAGCAGQHTDTDPWLPHITIAYSRGTAQAAPVIAALGRHLPPAEITIRSVSLVAQDQVGHSWRWQPIAEVQLDGS
jgi:2'-5' RNA ligase